MTDDDGQEASVEMDVRALGLDMDPDSMDTAELSITYSTRSDLLRSTLLYRASAWVGRDFAGDDKEQCANFIRRLFAESGIFVPPCEKPFDFHLTDGLEQGPDFANSFFSAANGRLLGYSDLEEGDLLSFRDTYQGDFPGGCITHVGLYVDRDTMIDRSTAGEPIREQELDAWWKERFVVGLRPHDLCD